MLSSQLLFTLIQENSCMVFSHTAVFWLFTYYSSVSSFFLRLPPRRSPAAAKAAAADAPATNVPLIPTPVLGLSLLSKSTLVRSP